MKAKAGQPAASAHATAYRRPPRALPSVEGPRPQVPLREIAATSVRVSETASRRQKVGCLAGSLCSAAPPEVEIAVAFLSGSPRQGRIGIGPAALRRVPVVPAANAKLILAQTDAAPGWIAATRGRSAVPAFTD